MAQVSYPGVYINEVASGVRTIVGVSTSVAAFVGYFRKGPLNEPVKIFGLSDFDRIFGGLHADSETSYAITQFFLNGGTEAWVIRTASGAIRSASVGIETAIAPALLMTVAAANAGVWGNDLRVKATPVAGNAARFNLEVVVYENSDPAARAFAAEKFTDLSADPADAKYFVTIINDQSTLIEVTHADVTVINPPALNGTLGAEILDADYAATVVSTDTRAIEITYAGATGVATIALGGDPEPTTLRGFRPYLQAAINALASSDLTFSSMKVEVANNRLLITSGRSSSYAPDGLIVIADDPGNTGLAAALGLIAGTGIENVQEYSLGYTTAATVGFQDNATITNPDGNDGSPPTALELVGDESATPKTGMMGLLDVDLFTILSIPGAADLTDAQLRVVYSRAIQLCEDERAFLLVDIPELTNTYTDVIEWVDDHADLKSNHAAVYFPRLGIPDPLDDYRLRDVAASGTIAGLYSRTDSTRGVWKAPAGTEANLAGVTSLAIEINDAENGALNPLGINALRRFPVYGNVSWGARTLQGSDQEASEWKYVPIRRLALFIEESLFRGTQWVVFEPNDEPLWAKIRLNVGAFMNGLFRQGAFQGSSPRDAYFVKCDAETTTQADRNLGIVNIQVGFAPLKPAEFVIISIQQIAGDIAT